MTEVWAAEKALTRAMNSFYSQLISVPAEVAERLPWVEWQIRTSRQARPFTFHVMLSTEHGSSSYSIGLRKGKARLDRIHDTSSYRMVRDLEESRNLVQIAFNHLLHWLTPMWDEVTDIEIESIDQECTIVIETKQYYAHCRWDTTGKQVWWYIGPVVGKV